MRSETDLKNVVLKRLRTLDGIWFYKSQEVSVRGIPDIIGCFKGRFFAIELKKSNADKSSSQELQEYNINKIRKCQGLAFFWTPENWEEYFETFFLEKHKTIKAPTRPKGRAVADKPVAKIYTSKDLYG